MYLSCFHFQKIVLLVIESLVDFFFFSLSIQTMAFHCLWPSLCLMRSQLLTVWYCWKSHSNFRLFSSVCWLLIATRFFHMSSVQMLLAKYVWLTSRACISPPVAQNIWIPYKEPFDVFQNALLHPKLVLYSVALIWVILKSQGNGASGFSYFLVTKIIALTDDTPSIVAPFYQWGKFYYFPSLLYPV